VASIPWFPLFAADLLMDDDLFKMDPKAEGLLVRMWCLCWVDGYAPKDTEALSLKVRRPISYVRKYLPEVIQFFQVDEQGNLWSQRLEVERAKAADKSEKCKAAINFRWEKRKKVCNTKEQTPVHTDVSTDGIPSPSPSPSLKETTPLPPKGGTRRRRGQAVDDLLAVGEISPEAVQFGKAMVQGWKTQDPDGRPIRSNLTEVITRMDGIAKRQPIFSPEIQFKAGMDYLAEERKSYKAAQYFLSLEPDAHTGMPPFKPYCVAVVRSKNPTQAQPQEVPLAS
jgi:uncharacterized protein YdaU (DUF1376 family)